MITQTARKEIEKEFRDAHKEIEFGARGDEFEKLTLTQKAAINSESCYALEAIAQNKQILKNLDETTKELAIKACDVIDAMALVHDQKIESINKLREWRKTIESECLLAKSAASQLLGIITPEKLNELKQVVELLERLNSVKPSPILSKILCG